MVTTQPFSFYNRRQQRISGELLVPPDAKGWAVIVHGLGGSRAEPQMKMLAEAAVSAGYATIFYDASNSFGASGGTLDQLTPTTHIHDLEDVIAYCEAQKKAAAPYVLLGHSLGSFAILHYAAHNLDKVAAIAPLSAVLGGDATWQAWQNADPKLFADWHRTGSYPKANPLNPSQTGSIGWNYIADMKHYDMLKEAPQITAPALLMVGARDRMTPPHTQLQLKDKLAGPVEKTIIDDCGHTYHQPEHLARVKEVVTGWLERLRE